MWCRAGGGGSYFRSAKRNDLLNVLLFVAQSEELVLVLLSAELVRADLCRERSVRPFGRDTGDGRVRPDKKRSELTAKRRG